MPLAGPLKAQLTSSDPISDDFIRAQIKDAKSVSGGVISRFIFRIALSCKCRLSPPLSLPALHDFLLWLLVLPTPAFGVAFRPLGFTQSPQSPLESCRRGGNFAPPRQHYSTVSFVALRAHPPRCKKLASESSFQTTLFAQRKPAPAGFTRGAQRCRQAGLNSFFDILTALKRAVPSRRNSSNRSSDSGRSLAIRAPSTVLAQRFPARAVRMPRPQAPQAHFSASGSTNRRPLSGLPASVAPHGQAQTFLAGFGPN